MQRCNRAAESTTDHWLAGEGEADSDELVGAGAVRCGSTGDADPRRGHDDEAGAAGEDGTSGVRQVPIPFPACWASGSGEMTCAQQSRVVAPSILFAHSFDEEGIALWPRYRLPTRQSGAVCQVHPSFRALRLRKRFRRHLRHGRVTSRRCCRPSSR